MEVKCSEVVKKHLPFKSYINNNYCYEKFIYIIIGFNFINILNSEHNIRGRCVKAVKAATEIATDGLNKGVYILKAGSEVVKFVK